jgi:ParB/RepB/Spo0J family partition protein
MAEINNGPAPDPAKHEKMEITDLPMEELHADEEFNCRGEIAPIDVTDLSRSMDAHGLQQPIEVQPYSEEMRTRTGKRFRIVCGHRRHKAATLLRWRTIPGIIKHNLTEAEARIRNLSENLNRKDLNVMQEARALRNLKDAGLSQDDVARELNKSRGWVQIRFMLLDLQPEIQAEAAAGLLNQEQIRDLYTLRGDPDAQAEAVRTIKDARERGEKPVKLKKPAKSVHAKTPRGRQEVFAMIEHIIDHVGVSFGTRCLAWAAGEISEHELHLDIAEEARKQGKRYDVPTETVSEVPAGGYANQAFG